jgi:ADP-heptose:LPS heptosyltransferase
MNPIIFDGALGDTITLSGVLKDLHKKTNELVTLYTNWPEIFDNNPYIKSSLPRNRMLSNLEPCRNVFVNNLYSCNCVKHYYEQLGIEYPSVANIDTKIYFTDEEIKSAEEELKEFSQYKKIAVCLYSSSPSRDVTYEFVNVMLKKLKIFGAKLIFFGTKLPNDYDNLFDKFVVGDAYVGLRRVFYLMNRCDLYLGVDTGLFHAAAAVGIPQFVFFRNNGCNVNAYKNTYYFDSKIECSDVCRTTLNVLKIMI